MKPVNPYILAINGGSSSIKFALFKAGESTGKVMRLVFNQLYIQLVMPDGVILKPDMCFRD